MGVMPSFIIVEVIGIVTLHEETRNRYEKNIVLNIVNSR
jgi:hypothetical protein